MALNLTERMLELLKSKPGDKFTAREVAEWISRNYRKECQDKIGRSKNRLIQKNATTQDIERLLIDILVAEIGAQRINLQRRTPQLKTIEGRPRRFYYTDKSDETEVAEAENRDIQKSVLPLATSRKEHDLYPLLSDYLATISVHSKRIDEKRSSNSRGMNGNRWLHPDLVGLEVLSQDWDREVKECVKQYGARQTKLWSFEVKPLLNGSNVREAYFQAVSNSTWANLAYLVAGEIEGADTMRELRLLAGLHGVGFIRLDAEEPAESEILIPARERAEVDWNSANRLTKENKDFLEYIKLIRQFHQTGEVRPQDWDAEVN